jgi:ubiquinone/menaquinone biosynthesis C-methylase UbiE
MPFLCCQRGVRTLLEETQLNPGEAVLEVGCGTGVLDRWLARRTTKAHRITGVDINPYLLLIHCSAVPRWL